MLLRSLAHVRTGDKGDVSQISVIANDPAAYPLLAAALTPDRIAAHLCGLPIRAIDRYELPGLGALIFVLHGALDGGVTRSLALDPHGKTIGAQLLLLDVAAAPA